MLTLSSFLTFNLRPGRSDMKTALFITLAAASASLAQPLSPRADLEAALKADPNDATALMRLGVLLQSEGDLDAGGDFIEAAYKLDPSLVTDIVVDAPGARGSVCPSATGPDVIVGEITGVIDYAHTGPAQDGITAFGIGTTSCNLGDEVLDWVSSTPNHPLIAQNLYRVKDGRFEQIGMSWLKHAFGVLPGNACCSCTGGFGGLAPGCSDPYSSGLNAGQSRLGPRFEVNATTGVYDYPFTSPPYEFDSIDRRCQAADADLDPSRNAGARWFAEGHYVALDDAESGNAHNNASYREVSFSARGDAFRGGLIGATVREQPAIMAWTDAEPSAVVQTVDDPDNGRFYVGHNVIDNGDGTWRYEYAVHNLNSDRSGQAFSVQVPSGVALTNVGFNDIDYHSGEPFDGTDWEFSRDGSTATWRTDSFETNENANALRWGTSYSFWFTADAEPVNRNGELEMFKPSARGDNTLSFTLAAPVGEPCVGDINGSGSVDSLDLAVLLAGWGAIPNPADLNGTGTVDAADLAILLAAWGDCM